MGLSDGKGPGFAWRDGCRASRGLSLPVSTTCVSVRTRVRMCVCLLRMWPVGAEVHDSFCLLCVCVGCARCKYCLHPSLRSSPLYHHDNLLTPAQPHAANISLPTPPPFNMFVLLTPSPSPSPSLPLYFILSLPSSPVCLHILLLPISWLPRVPVTSARCRHLKEFLLPDCCLCRKSVFLFALLLRLTYCLCTDCLSLLISV